MATRPKRKKTPEPVTHTKPQYPWRIVPLYGAPRLGAAERVFAFPGEIGLAWAILFPGLLCALKVYYSEPFVFRWAPWLLASGPLAYAVFRWGFSMKPAAVHEMG